MELAKAWLNPVLSVPEEIVAVFASTPHTSEFRIESVVGEFEQRLDTLGTPRHVDLQLFGTSNGSKVIVHIEAKADEEFDSRSVAGAWKSGLARSRNSGIPQRIRQLSSLLFGTNPRAGLGELPESVLRLKYQLLFGVAAPLLQACWLKPPASTAVFLVHELLPLDLSTAFPGKDGRLRSFSASKVRKNAADLDALVQLLTRGSVAGLRIGELVDCGTFCPPASCLWDSGTGDSEIRLLVGKVRTATVPDDVL